MTLQKTELYYCQAEIKTEQDGEDLCVEYLLLLQCLLVELVLFGAQVPVRCSASLYVCQHVHLLALQLKHLLGCLELYTIQQKLSYNGHLVNSGAKQ